MFHQREETGYLPFSFLLHGFHVGKYSENKTTDQPYTLIECGYVVI